MTGRINDIGSALLGGLIAGAVIGTGQWLLARRLLGNPQVWIPATAVAMGIGRTRRRRDAREQVARASHRPAQQRRDNRDG